jgi:tetratricopeptide (TPR) repeat protein
MSRAQKLVEAGDRALEQRDLAAAEKAYREALELDPDHVEALHSVGFVELQKNRFDAAVSVLQPALELDPNHRGARGLLANAFLGQKRYADAKREFIAVLDDDTPPSMVGQIGLCCEGEGNYEEAETWLRRALESDPSYITRFNPIGMFSYGSLPADMHHALARVLQRQGKVDEAKLHYHLSKRNDATVELDPMYREIMSDADLEDHVGWDAPEAPPAGGTERLVWLARLDDWERMREVVGGFSDEEVSELVSSIHAAQKANKLYASARLRLVGDAIENEIDTRSTFEELTSLPWQRFFELVERSIDEEIEPDELIAELDRLEFGWETFPPLLRLLRRFVEIDLRTGLALAESARRLSARAPDASDRVSGALLYALALHRAGQSERALDLLDRISETESNVTEMTSLEALHYRCMILGETGEEERALSPLSELIERATTGGHEDWEIEARINRVQLYLALDRPDEARRDCERILVFGERAMAARRPGLVAGLLQRVAERTGKPWPEDVLPAPVLSEETAEGLYRQAIAAMDAERTEQAIELLEQAEQAAVREHQRLGTAQTRVLRAKLLAQLDRLDEAYDVVQVALTIGEPLGPNFDTVGALILAGQIAHGRDEMVEAVGHVERALGLARAQQDEERIRELLRFLSALLIETDPDRAIALFGESLAGDTSEGQPAEWQDAEAAMQQGNLPGAIAAFDRLLASESPETEKLQPLALTNRAMLKLQLGRFDDAVWDLRAAIELFRSRGEERRVAECMAKLAMVRERSGDEPSPELAELVRYAEVQQHPPIRRAVSGIAGQAAFELGRYEIAQPLLLTAIEIASSGDWRDARDEFEARATLGQLYRHRQRFGDALQQYERALAIVDRLGDPGKEAGLRGNMAIALRYLDRLDEAVEQYERAIAIGETQGLPELCANHRINLAQSLFLLGRTASAVETALLAHRYYESQSNHDMAMRALVVIGQSCDPADLPLDVQLKIAQLEQEGLESDEPLIRCWAESQAAVACALEGRLEEGLKHIRAVVARQRASGDLYNQARTWLGWARALIDNDAEESLAAAERAHDLATEINQQALLAEIEEALCRTYLRLGDGERAETLFTRLREQWVKLRTSLDREIDRVRFADHTTRLTAELAAFRLQEGRPAAALEILDTGRSPALLDRTVDEEMEPATIETMDRLLRRLGPGSALVHLAWIGDEVLALTLRAGESDPEVQLTGVSRADVESALQAFDREIRLYRGEGAAVWEQRVKPIFAAIEGRIPEDGTVVLIPEEELSPLPLHAVPLSDGTRLLERAAVIYAPSMRFLGRLATRDDWGGELDEFLAIGVAFQDEALMLCQQFGAMGLTGNQLDPGNVLDRIERARIAHVACHGHFDPDHHLESGLVLRNTDRVLARDVLTVRELLGRRTNAELVVLSACETGRGIASASDYLGLGRAWLAAGARAMVTALWNVENRATQSLMLEFYRLLLDGEGEGERNVAEALRAAQIAAARTSGFYDWAAFRLTGWPWISAKRKRR